MDILQFMQTVYAANEVDKRKMKFLYHQSGIEQRYSVLADYSKAVSEWKLFYSMVQNDHYYKKIVVQTVENKFIKKLFLKLASTGFFHVFFIQYKKK